MTYVNIFLNASISLQVSKNGYRNDKSFFRNVVPIGPYFTFPVIYMSPIFQNSFLTLKMPKVRIFVIICLCRVLFVYTPHYTFLLIFTSFSFYLERCFCICFSGQKRDAPHCCWFAVAQFLPGWLDYFLDRI